MQKVFFPICFFFNRFFQQLIRKNIQKDFSVSFFPVVHCIIFDCVFVNMFSFQYFPIVFSIIFLFNSFFSIVSFLRFFFFKSFFFFEKVFFKWFSHSFSYPLVFF